MTTSITLQGIEVFGTHGVLPQERQHGQRFVIDLALELTSDVADDDLAATVDYGQLTEDVVANVSGTQFQLIETLANELAQQVVAHPLVAQVTVTVHKPQAPIGTKFADVAVTRTLSRDDD